VLQNSYLLTSKRCMFGLLPVVVICAIDVGIESDIGREYAKVTMAAAIRQQVHKGDVELESVIHSTSKLPADVVHHAGNRSLESIRVHRRMERDAKMPKKSVGDNLLVAPLAVNVEKAASMSGKDFPAEKKAKRKNSLVEPLAADMERAASMSRKSLSSPHDRDSIVAPLAINTSLVMLKLVSHFSLFAVSVLHTCQPLRFWHNFYA